MKKGKFFPTLLSGLIVGLLAMFLFTGLVNAAPSAQGEDPPEEILTDKDCVKCHRNVAGDWSPSPHAHAYDDPDLPRAMARPGLSRHLPGLPHHQFHRLDRRSMKQKVFPASPATAQLQPITLTRWCLPL